MASNIAFPEALQSLAHGSITTGYSIVGAKLPNPLRMFRLVNATDGDVIFSLDGVTDHFFVPAGSFVLYDVAGNSGQSSNFRIRANTAFYVKYSTSPSKSSVYVESIYGIPNQGFGD
jgi:hypothetical protein